MSRIALYFASGESFYAGAATLVLATAVSPLLKHRWMLQLRNIATWLALALIVMACPTFAWSVDLIFVAVFAAWYVLSNRSLQSSGTSKPRLAVGAALIVLLSTLSVSEFSHRSMPVITGAPSDHLVVIGDSISSGIDASISPWPVVLEKSTGIRVRTLARPGALAADAKNFAKEVLPDDRVVLVEIGGNDLLSDVPSRQFGQDLDATLARLTAPGRTVVMFELPLFPNKIAYGQIQRRLAARYGVWLIPKRYFTDVIGGAGATSDGLHLSKVGARRMARLVAQALSRVLKPD
jgi:acyl-CoA thioesterase I